MQQCYDTFINILNDLCDKYVPPIKSNSAPTLSSNGSSVKRYPSYIRKLLHLKLAAWRNWKLSKSAVDKDLYAVAKLNYSAATKKFEAAKELELIRKNNVRCFYNFVNRKTSSRAGITC